MALPSTVRAGLFVGGAMAIFGVASYAAFRLAQRSIPYFDDTTPGAQFNGPLDSRGMNYDAYGVTYDVDYPTSPTALLQRDGPFAEPQNPRLVAGKLLRLMLLDCPLWNAIGPVQRQAHAANAHVPLPITLQSVPGTQWVLRNEDDVIALLNRQCLSGAR